MPTTIQLKQETLKRLKTHKIASRQSYDEVLNRLLDEAEDDTLTAEEIEDLQEALEEVKRGELYSIEDIAKELGITLR